MKTDINLPVILDFSTDFLAETFRSQLETIIPKIKFEECGDGSYIFFTRKDKNYREMMESSEDISDGSGFEPEDNNTMIEG